MILSLAHKLIHAPPHLNVWINRVCVCERERELPLRPMSRVQKNSIRLLSGPLNRLNAILSLLHPLDRYRTLSAIGSAIGRPYLAPSHIQAQVGVLNCLARGLNRAMVALSCVKPLDNKHETKRDRGRDSQLRPRPRLNSHPQGATKRSASKFCHIKESP